MPIKMMGRIEVRLSSRTRLRKEGSSTRNRFWLAQFDRTTSVWGPITLALGFLVSLAAAVRHRRRPLELLPAAVLRRQAPLQERVIGNDRSGVARPVVAERHEPSKRALHVLFRSGVGGGLKP